MVGLSGLWFGFLAGPAAWTLQELADTAITSHECFPRLFPLASPSMTGMRGLLFAVSVFAILLCLAGATISWRDWTMTRTENHESTGKAVQHAHPAALLETGEGRTRFMALSGVLTSVTFLIVVIANSVSIFLVTPCPGQ